jgi:hypothetical protein
MTRWFLAAKSTNPLTQNPDHAAVAVEENQWFASSTLDVVQPNTVYLQELTLRRVVAHSFPSEMSVHQGG